MPSIDTNRTRLVRKARPTESFFNFFSPPVPPTQDAIDNEEIDEDFLDDLDEKLERDYQLGEDIKEKIVPKAVDYFTGKALEYDLMDEDDDDYEDIDDDDDDDDLDDVSVRLCNCWIPPYPATGL
jgi:nucleosome assembly protein 1-like 1